jgi:tetratricopeptide (TPR) repeat protein
LYAEYFASRFGDDSLPKLLNAYRDTRSTDQALQTAYGAKKDDVEAGYREFLKQRVAKLPAFLADEPRDPAAIRRRYEERPNDSDAIAAFARLQLRLGKAAEAVKLAEDVLAINPRHALAATVIAETNLRKGKVDEAAEALVSAYDPQAPHPALLWLLGQVRLKQTKSKEALQLFQQGRDLNPDEPVWLRGMIEASDAAGEMTVLNATLKALSERDPDDVDSRVRLAELAYKAGDFAKAAKYAKLALHVDVLDADLHILLARSFLRLQQTAAALDEFGVAVQLKPGESDWSLEYAEAQWDAGHKDEARARVDALLKKHPNHATARIMSERWAQ